jgi:hypothetical protein
VWGGNLIFIYHLFTRRAGPVCDISVITLTLGQVFLPVLLFSPVSIIPPMLHTHYQKDKRVKPVESPKSGAISQRGIIRYVSGFTRLTAAVQLASRVYVPRTLCLQCGTPFACAFTNLLLTSLWCDLYKPRVPLSLPLRKPYCLYVATNVFIRLIDAAN